MCVLLTLFIIAISSSFTISAAGSCCDESILLPFGDTEFNILNCYGCLFCFLGQPYNIHVEWQDEQGHQGTASENSDGQTYKIMFSDLKDPGVYTFSVIYYYLCHEGNPPLRLLTTHKVVYVYGAIASHEEDDNTTYIECSTGVDMNDGLTMNISFTSADHSSVCSAGCMSSQCVWNNASWIESEGMCILTIDHPVLSDSGNFCCIVSNGMNSLNQCSNLSVVSDYNVTTSPPPNKHDDSEMIDIIIGSITISLSIIIIVVFIGGVIIYRWRRRHIDYDDLGGRNGGPWDG